MEGRMRCSAGAGRVAGALGRGGRYHIHRLAVWLLSLIVFALAAQAWATSYVYDANGRLTAVTNDAGESARYVYDVMGNIQKVERFAAGELVLFGFSPGRGVSGTPVRIQGQGFSVEPTANAVRFGGVSADVLGASASELQVVVPTGAVTGPISVTVGAKSVTSRTDFVVDQSSRTPRIDSFSPQIVSAGAKVTLLGDSLYPLPHQTTVRVGTRSALVTRAANNEVEFSVPLGGASSRVSLSTPYGLAVSDRDLVVLPSGVTAAEIAAVRRVQADGVEIPLSTQNAGQQVAILFDAELGGHLDVQMSAITAGNLAYALYDPSNRKVVDGTATTSDPTVLLPPAAKAGTHLLLIKPSQSPASWKLAIERSRMIMADGETLPLATTIAGQKKRFIFSGSVDQRLGLGLEGLTLSSGTSMYATVMNRSNTVVSASCLPSYDGCQLNIRAPQTAIYSVVFAPSSTAQTFQGKVTLTNDLRMDLQRETPLRLVVPRRGQNARLLFNAQAGESLSFQVMGQTTLPAGRYVNYAVYKPDGTLFSSANVTTHQFFNLPSLPQTGQYFVFVDADFGATSTARVILSEGRGGGGEVDGEVGDFQTESGGQSVYFNFTATEVDQRIGIGISDLTLSNGNYVWVYVFQPDGTSLGTTTCYQSDGGCGINVRATKVGRYSVRVEPLNATQTMRLRALVTTDLHADIARESPYQLSTSRRGMNARLYFNAEAGETLGIQIAGQSTEPSAKNVSYQVYGPDGALLTSVNSAGSDTLRLPTLSASGRYMLFVDPAHGATLQSRITLTSGRQSGLEIDGAAGGFVAPVAGQPALITFTTTIADQRLGLGIRDLELSTGSYANVSVHGPSGDLLVSRACQLSDGGCDLNIRAPKVGTHMVVVAPQLASQAMRFTAFLSNDQIIDLSREQPLSLNISRPGQNARLRFSASVGDSLALQISGQTSTANRTVYYTVYKPDGNSLTSVGTSAFESLRMMNLPVAGEYFVFVDPNYGATVQSRVLLTAGNGSSPVIDGESGQVTTAAGGQATFTTFKVDEVDQRLGIGISDLQLSNGSSAVTVTLARPNGGSAGSVTCYQSQQGCDLNLRAPEAGVYGIVMTPHEANQTMSYSLTVSNDLRQVLSRETTQTLNIARRGQNGRMTFNAQAGETLALQIAGQSTQPAGRQVVYGVYKPDGTSLISRSTSSFETLNLPSLPVSGEYLVFVDPNYGSTVTSKVTLTTGAGGGTEIDGGQGEFATTVPGQPIYMTFQATAGEQLGLGISDLTVSNGSYVSVAVYRPNGNTATSTTCSVSDQGCALGINAVESGTYSVVTTPQSANQTVQYKATLSRDLRIPVTRDVPLDLVIARRGQRARLSFNGEAGDTLSLQVAGQSTFPAGRSAYYRVLKPDGNSLDSFSTTGHGSLEMRLPVSGAYQVLVEPRYGETLNSRVTLAVGNAQAIDGDPTSVETSLGGQSVRATFQATAGQKLGIGVYDLSLSSGSYVNVAAYRPDGGLAASTSCYASQKGCKLSVQASQSGIYSMAVVPTSANQTLSYKWMVSQDRTGTLTANQPLDLVLPRRGQNARLSFSGAAGDTFSVQVSGQSTTPVGGSVYYRVYKPDGSSLSSFSTTNFGALELRLPVGGEYQVFVDSAYGETVTSRLTLDAGDPQSIGGEPAAVETTHGGQSTRGTFDAVAGQQLGIGIYDLSVSSGSYVYATIYRPDGSQLTSATCYISNKGCKLNVSVNSTGRHSVVITPQSASQTFAYTWLVSLDQLGALLPNEPLNLVLPRRGQNARLSFTGAAGDAVALQVAAQTTFPVDGTIYYRVVKPDGGTLVTMGATGHRSQELRLPVAGTYQVFVDSTYGQTVSSRVTLASGAVQLIGGEPAAVQTQHGGQSTHARFQANAGQRLSIGIHDLTVSSGSYVSVAVYRPDGAAFTSTTCSASNQGCKLSLAPTVSGTYSIAVTPQSSSQTFAYKLTLSQDIEGVLQLDRPHDLSVGRRGQNARFTFDGQAGQWLSLQIAGQVTLPAERTIYYRVYRPDGTQWTSTYTSSFEALRLPVLPTTGQYSVLVDSTHGESLQARLTLASGASGLRLDGSDASIVTDLGGQEVFLTFGAKALQRVTVGLSNLHVSSGTYFAASLHGPDGVTSSANCYPQNGGCQMKLTANVDGTYRLYARPVSGNQQIGFTATASTDVTGVLRKGAPLLLSLPRVGQNGWLSFDGTGGEKLAMHFTGPVTQPSGGNVYCVIYKPDGSALTGANVTTNQVLQLPALPSGGTYRMMVSPDYGRPLSMSIELK